MGAGRARTVHTVCLCGVGRIRTVQTYCVLFVQDYDLSVPMSFFLGVEFVPPFCGWCFCFVFGAQRLCISCRVCFVGSELVFVLLA